MHAYTRSLVTRWWSLCLDGTKKKRNTKTKEFLYSAFRLNRLPSKMRKRAGQSYADSQTDYYCVENCAE